MSNETWAEVISFTPDSNWEVRVEYKSYDGLLHEFALPVIGFAVVRYMADEGKPDGTTNVEPVITDQEAMPHGKHLTAVLSEYQKEFISPATMRLMQRGSLEARRHG